MRTRSANKNDVSFVMLDDDKKSARRQDFDKYGHIIKTQQKESSSTKCKTNVDRYCGSRIFITPLNLVVAGLLVVILMALSAGITHMIGKSDGNICQAIKDAILGLIEWCK